MRERVWGSPDVGRAPGCVMMQGRLPGSMWNRGMWRGVARQVRTHRTHQTQEMRRLRQDATQTDQTQGPFLLMNTAPAGLASPRSVCLWVDRPSEVRPSSPLPARMDKIQWQTHEHVYWMELTEPTLANLVGGIDRILSRGFIYRMRVGATGQGTHLQQDDPEEPLPLAEIIRITNSRHLPRWWSLNPRSEPMDLLFCAHRSTNTEDSTPAPGDLRFDPRDNRGTPSDEEWPRCDEELNC